MQCCTVASQPHIELHLQVPWRTSAKRFGNNGDRGSIKPNQALTRRRCDVGVGRAENAVGGEPTIRVPGPQRIAYHLTAGFFVQPGQYDFHSQPGDYSMKEPPPGSAERASELPATKHHTNA